MLKSTSLIFALLASTASAQGFEGAQVELIYHSYDSYDVTRLEAGANYAITDRIGVQVDLGGYGYDSDPISEYRSYGLHAYYDVSDSVAIGAFYASTDFGGATEAYTGLEAIYATGPLSVQGYYAAVYYNGNDSGNKAFGLGAEYEVASISSFGDLSLIGNFSRFDRDGGTDYTMTEIGAQLKTDSGAYAQLEMGRNSSDFSEDDHVTFTIGYEFGAGTRFDQRSYQAIWSGY